MEKLLRRYLRITHRLFPNFVALIVVIIKFVQRGIYGWSSYDCWAADLYLARLMIEMIPWLKKNKSGVPHEFVMRAMENRIAQYETNADCDTENGIELYNKMLDEVVYGLLQYQEMMEGDWCYKTEQELQANQKKMQEQQKAFRKSMILLAKHFHTLGL